MSAEILTALVRVNLVASVAILLVLALRPWVLRWLGASIAHWLWLVIPIAAAATFVPAREQVAVAPPPALVAPAREATDAVVTAPVAEGALAEVAPQPLVSVPALADVLVVVWLVTALALLVRSIVSTRRLAADPSIGPALVGVLRPRLVLPADFEMRFDAQERALILAHEEVHRVSGHTVANALVEVARCASWFNPLVHLAAIRIRTDQELACDAAVIAARPTERRAYTQALLKAQIAATFLPLGCTWTSPSARRMAERIEMVGRAPLGRRGKIAGASGVAAVGLVLGFAAWAQQPPRTVPPQAVWTPSADAPVGTLSHALEGQRHDFFIDLAQKGNIDVVFFGTTDTEMWWWPDRGRSVWDRAFESVKAANFGSQGTHFESLLWRMRNGELAGYQAKLVVLQALGPIEAAIPVESEAELVTNHAAVIAEVRARQPQAKTLILARFPRGHVPREVWREIAATNAAVYARLADDETVFYADIGERFFKADGSFKRELWGSPSAGMQEPAFEVWAEELQPWLDRFVR